VTGFWDPGVRWKEIMNRLNSELNTYSSTYKSLRGLITENGLLV